MLSFMFGGMPIHVMSSHGTACDKIFIFEQPRIFSRKMSRNVMSSGALSDSNLRVVEIFPTKYRNRHETP